MASGAGAKALAAVMAAAFVFSGIPLAAWASTPEPQGAPQPDALPAGHAVWPQFGVTTTHNFSYGGPERGFPTATLKWQQGATNSGGTTLANFSSRVVLDNASAPPEVLGVVFAQGLAVRAMAGNNGTTMWSYPISGGAFATPVLTDLDGDSKLDVVIRSDTGLLEAVAPNITWNGAGYSFPVANATEIAAQQLWNASLVGDASTNNNVSTPIVVDLANDGLPEVLAPAGDRLYLINGQTGAELANRTVQGYIASAPTAFRVSGVWRILVASYNLTGANLSTVTANYTVSSFDSNLNPQWTLTFPQSYDTALIKSLDLQFPSPAAGNLDGAGPRDDVAVVTPYEGSVSRLRVMNNGTAVEAVNVSLQGMTGASPSVTDIDGDGRDEVVALSYEPGRPLAQNALAFVEVFDGNGSRRWNTTIDELPAPDREHTVAPPALADFDRDGVLDVVVLLTDGWTEVLSGADGARILRTNLLNQATPTEYSAPAVADIDADGYLDIVANGAAISYALPNLVVAPEDISVNPPSPEQFEEVTVGVTVHNDGNLFAPNVSVRLLDGAQVLNESSVPSIIAGFSSLVQMQVNFTQGGNRTLCAEVDWNDTIEELDETDNTACTPVNVSSLYGFTFSAPSNQTVVQPGFSHVFILNVDSEATQANTVDLSHGPLPAGWGASLSPASLGLEPKGSPGDSNTSFFSVTTSGLSAQGEYDILVEGVSAVDARSRTNMTFTVVIGGQYGVAIFPPAANGTVAAGDNIAYSFSVFNSGNSNDTLDLTNSTPPPGWSALRSRDSVLLAPGQSTTVFMIVYAPPNATQGEAAEVSLTVRSRTDPTKTDSSLTTTSVVIPDIVLTDIQFFRRCGGEASTGTPRLIAGEASLIVVSLANAAGNGAISSVGVNLWVDGDLHVASGPIPAAGTGNVYVNVTLPSEGTTTVTAEADPNDVWSEVNELNNDRTEQVAVKDTLPIGPLTVEGWVTSGASPASFADITVAVPARGTNLTLAADVDGFYRATLTAAQYRDGDLLNITATDGLDIGWATPAPCAYSEDVVLQANVTLGLPSPYDFLLVPPALMNASAVPGAPARYPVQVINRGPYNNSVLVSAESAWPARVLDQNNTTVTALLLPPNGMADVTLEVTVPAGTMRGDWTLAWLNATAVADTSRSRSLAFNTTAATLRSLLITGPVVVEIWSGTGENAFVNVTVENRGNGDETVTLSDEDTNGSGAVVQFTPPTLTLAPGATGVSELRISIGSAASGRYPINVTATSDADPSASATHTVTLDVTAIVYEFTLNGAPSVLVKPGSTRTTSLTITNRGTVPDTYNVTITPPGSGFTVEALDAFGVPQTQFFVDVGASLTVPISITAPRAVDRPSLDIDLAVASSGGAPTQAFVVRAVIGDIHDLSASDLSLAATPMVEIPVQVSALVRNVGTRDLTAPVVVVFKVEGQQFGQANVSSLAVGAEQAVTFSWTPRVQGVVSLSVEVNPLSAGSDVYESSFTNNVATRDVQVEPQRAPDILSQPGTLIALAVIVGILSLVALGMRGRRVEPGAKKSAEEAEEEAEEIQERRLGKGPGGLNKI